MDVSLIRRAKEKDEEAIRMIILITEKRAFFTANASLRNPETAADIVQETYVTAFSKLNKLEDESKFDSWFNSILNRNIIDYIRSHHHHNEQMSTDFSSLSSDDDDWDVESNIQSDYSDWQPEKHVNMQEIKEGVQNLLNELPANQRMALIQYYFNQQKISEIAEEQQVSTNTVKGWLNYGKNKLKARIEEMRKQNISFYSIAPIPLLYHCCQDMMFTTPDIQISVDAVVKGMAGIGAGLGAGHTVVEGIVGTFKQQIIANKAVSLVTASCVAVGGVATVEAIRDEGQQYTVCSAADYPVVHYEYVGSFPYDSATPVPSNISENGLDLRILNPVTFTLGFTQSQKFMNDIMADYNSKYSFYDPETKELKTNAVKVSGNNLAIAAIGNNQWAVSVDFGCYADQFSGSSYPVNTETGKLYLDVEEFNSPGKTYKTWFMPYNITTPHNPKMLDIYTIPAGSNTQYEIKYLYQ